MSSPSNYIEPSAAVAGVVIAGGRSVRFHGEKAAKRIQFPQTGAFANVNTRSDLAVIASKLEQDAFEQLHRSRSLGLRVPPAGEGYQR